MPSITVPIRKMHCKSCVLLLEASIRKIPGVRSVRVSLKDASATIQGDEALDLSEVHAAIVDAGYEVGEHTEVPWLATDGQEYGLIVIAGVLALTFYAFLKVIGVDRLVNFAPSSATGSLAVFLIGLTAGVSTCMAIVGGLVLAISARFAEKHPGATAVQKLRPHLWFNLGRIIGFFLLGGLLGAIGGVFEFSSLTLGILTMLVGFVMLVLGIQLLEVSPRFSRFHVTLPASLGRFLGLSQYNDQQYSPAGSMLLGALTFFLPCGFTQAMQAAAVASGHFLSGAIIMAVFAIGTLPGLIGVGSISAFFRGIGAKIFFKTIGVIVIAIALFNFSGGFRLTGWTLPWSTTVTIPSDQPSAQVDNGVQVVNMEQSASGFSPNQFVVKQGIPVRWVINATNANTCSASIVVPALGIRRMLTLGENVIEFTPQNVGVIRFTCSMGMYPGQFVVTQ